jgi:hypothetical protein
MLKNMRERGNRPGGRGLRESFKRVTIRRTPQPQQQEGQASTAEAQPQPVEAVTSSS